MIKEALIEEILEQIESEKFEDNFATAQAEYWHYLNSESFKGLSTPEHQLSYFISSVIFHTATASETELPDLDIEQFQQLEEHCLLYTSPSPRDRTRSRMPSSA